MHTSRHVITTFSLAVLLFFNSPTLIASLESSPAHPRSPSPEPIPLLFLRDISAPVTGLRLTYSKRGVPVGISSSSSAAGRAGRAGAEDTTTTGSGTSIGSDTTRGTSESGPADEPIRGPEKPETPETPDVPDFGSGGGSSNSAAAPTDYPTRAGGFYTYIQPTYTPIVPSWPSSTTGSPSAMVTSAAESKSVQKWVGVGCTMFGFIVAVS